MKKIINKIKFYIKNFSSISSNKILDIIESKIDKKYCGISLVKIIPSLFSDQKNKLGMTRTVSTRYCVLKEIFSHIEISDDDSLVDIGCGMGRVLLYLANHYNCQLTGIEYNAEPASIGAKWAEQYEKVNIVQGDAFDLNVNDYTILYLFRPFLENTFEQFVEKLENELEHPIKLVYMSDVTSFKFLKNRDNWELKHRGKIFKYKHLQLYSVPQCYSIWDYQPK